MRSRAEHKKVLYIPRATMLRGPTQKIFREPFGLVHIHALTIVNGNLLRQGFVR